MRGPALLSVGLLWLVACTGEQSPSPTPSPSLSAAPTDTPTVPPINPAAGVVLTGTGVSDAREPIPTPSPASPTSPTPTAAEAWAPTRWQASLKISVGDLPGGALCEATYAEAGVVGEVACAGCDVVFRVNRTLQQADTTCVWPSSEQLDLAFFFSDHRVDRYSAPTEDGAEGTWAPWYEILSSQVGQDANGGWQTTYQLQGHPDAGFIPPLGKAAQSSMVGSR